jgi:hypothetical protein
MLVPFGDRWARQLADTKRFLGALGEVFNQKMIANSVIRINVELRRTRRFSDHITVRASHGKRWAASTSLARDAGRTEV